MKAKLKCVFHQHLDFQLFKLAVRVVFPVICRLSLFTVSLVGLGTSKTILTFNSRSGTN